MKLFCVRTINARMLLSAIAVTSIFATDAFAEPPVGKELLQTHCARCHAIDQTDKSPLQHAPPLRDIYRQYPTERLEFELSEGIGSRHRKMPQVQFSTEQVDRIMKYLESLSSTR